MQKLIRAAVVGYGNIGKYTLETLESSPDFEIAGVVRRSSSSVSPELQNYKVVTSINDLHNVDVAILCSPTRNVEKYAIECLSAGINTVDSFDIHSKILELRNSLNEYAVKNGAVSIISAGWDPEVILLFVHLWRLWLQRYHIYQFWSRNEYGHTVAVKAIDGVKAALSMTIPTGTGVHRRMVYIELEDGYNFQEVSQSIKADDYFAHDETHVFQVDDVEALKDMGHGVLMERKGASGETQNQQFKFDMRINNPALTAQVLVSAARATLRQSPGAYTMIEIPVVDLLPGEKEMWIKKLV